MKRSSECEPEHPGDWRWDAESPELAAAPSAESLPMSDTEKKKAKRKRPIGFAAALDPKQRR